MPGMRRREFVSLLGGAVAWPIAARAQQSAMPVIALLNGGAADAAVRNGAAFRKGLSETGCVEGRNVTVEYHWLEGQYHRVQGLVADGRMRCAALHTSTVSLQRIGDAFERLSAPQATGGPPQDIKVLVDPRL